MKQIGRSEGTSAPEPQRREVKPAVLVERNDLAVQNNWPSHFLPQSLELWIATRHKVALRVEHREVRGTEIFFALLESVRKTGVGD